MTGPQGFSEFRPLSLDAGPIVGPALARSATVVSEFAFANLYLFREAHRYRWSTWGNLCLLLGVGYDGVPYAFPPLGEGDVAEAVRVLSAQLEKEGVHPVFFPVPEELLGAFPQGDGWEAIPDRDQADYLYLRDELAELPGKKFHKRRNRLAKFLREEGANYTYRELVDADLETCLALSDGWCEIRCSLERPSTYQETAAVKEALLRRRELGLRGAVVCIGERVRAFCLGEQLRSDTFVVHFEKVEPGHEGLAQLINRDFCLHSLEGYRYVNREQDLGDPGLRAAKLAYHPLTLVAKYRVARR